MKLGRNDPCSCGSGKKFKHCCEGKVASRPSSPAAPAPAETNQLVALFNAGRYAEVESQARLLLVRYPNSGIAWKILGAALQLQGKDALPALTKSTELSPDNAEAHYNLAVAKKRLGLINDAVSSYRRALKIDPNYAEAHNNLGNALKDLGQLDDAVACYRRALQLKPKFADTHYSLGNTLKNLGRRDEAVASYQQALKLKPDFAAAHNNLGATLKELGRFEEASVCYRRFVALEPGSAEAHCNLGVALKWLGQLDNAIASYHRAIELKPDYAEAHSNLGTAFKDLGQIDNALNCYRRALQIKSDMVEPFTNLLFTLNYTASLSPIERLEEAREYGRMLSDKVTAPFTAWRGAAHPERLRVGMVSGDLCNHPVGYFLESLLAQLDPKRIELIAYPTDPKTDSLTQRIKPYFSSWRPLFGLNDEAAAKLIHADGVHVLLDLSGHTGNNRLPVFAWKPAPVQACWLGYFATTGVAEMDYFLADAVGVSETQRNDFTESVWYLPDTRLCFSPPEIDLPVSPLPALSNGHITFASFQNFPKIGDAALALWADILAALPDARLRLQCKQLSDPAVVAQLTTRLRQQGIDPERVALHGFAPRGVYLATHAEVDLLLDTFPYPGGTTTCEALWMGVPTLTLAGDTLLARQGASLLGAAGLDEWITSNPADYVAHAIALAGDLPKLASLRASLREQVRVSPLFDAVRFTRNFELALWGMWQARGQTKTGIGAAE